MEYSASASNLRKSAYECAVHDRHECQWSVMSTTTIVSLEFLLKIMRNPARRQRQKLSAIHLRYWRFFAIVNKDTHRNLLRYEAHSMAHTGTPVLDRVEGLRRVAGDERLYRDLVQVFLRDLPRILGHIDAAIAQDASAALQCATHSLKGSASQIGAGAVAELAAILEELGRRDMLMEAGPARQRLAEALDQLLAAWSESQPPEAPHKGGTHDQDPGRGACPGRAEG